MKKIAAITLALVMVVAFSASAFADGPMGNGHMGGPKDNQMQMGGGPMGGPQDNQMQMGGGPMGGPQDNQMQMGRGTMDRPQDNAQQPSEMPNGKTPQGTFEQNNQQPQEMPSAEVPQGGFEQNGPQTTGDDMTPRQGAGNGQNARMGAPSMGSQDPINAMFDAVNAIEDETVKANIEALMQAEFDAIVAERDAEDQDAAAEAVTAVREALQAALAEARVEVGFGPMKGHAAMNGLTPPGNERNDQMGSVPERDSGFDPINAIFEAVDALEDETVKANIEALLQAELDAMEAEREATDKEAAAEAVAAVREALQAALAEAGIEFTMPEMNGQFHGQQSQRF